MNDTDIETTTILINELLQSLKECCDKLIEVEEVLKRFGPGSIPEFACVATARKLLFRVYDLEEEIEIPDKFLKV